MNPDTRSRRLWPIAIAVIVLAAGGLALWRSSRASTSVRYMTTPVTRGDVTRAITATGSLNPVVTVQVGTYVSGSIQELYCDYNTEVRKGQLCAKIDPRPYQTVVDQDRANLSTARAQLAKDQANLAYAKVSRDRALSLRARQIVSQDDVDVAVNAYNQAVAQVDLDQSVIEQHRAALQAAEVNLAYTDIRSPVDGTVISRNVTRGQTVAASFQTPTLFLIAADLTRMQVDANVSEGDIGGIARGGAAAFTVEAYPSRGFEGTVSEVRQAPQMVQNVVTYDVVISVSNDDLLLRPGMTATVRIVIDKCENVIRVPDQALRYRPGGLSQRIAGAETPSAGPGGTARYVWVLREGTPTMVAVTTGLDDDTYTEILAGELTAGDEVITSESANSAASSRLMFRL